MIFYTTTPYEWCDRGLLTLVVETPVLIRGQMIEQYSYICIECIKESHAEALAHIANKQHLTRIK